MPDHKIPYAGSERRGPKTLDELARAQREKRAPPGKSDGRTARIDLRLTPSEKQVIENKAKATRRTVSSIMAQLIENIDKIIP